jgi:hypothetical protein
MMSCGTLLATSRPWSGLAPLGYKTAVASGPGTAQKAERCSWREAGDRESRRRCPAPPDARKPGPFGA